MALIATLQDNFNDNSLAAQWTNAGGARLTEVNQNIEITTLTTSGYYYMYSTSTYDLTNSQATVKMVSAGNQSLASLEVYPISLEIDTNNKIFFFVAGNTLYAMKTIAGVQTTVGSIAYNSTTMIYFGIFSSGGNITMKYSQDGLSWTALGAAFANPFVITAIILVIMTGTWNTEASGTTTKFDDVNILPSATNHNALLLLGVG
jgi:hypothetical protein